MWPRIRQRQRTRRSAWLMLFLALLLAVPWPGRISASAVLRPQESWPVFAPAGARIQAMPFGHGDAVAAGQPLVELFVPDLVTREKALQARMVQQRWMAEMAGFDEEMRKRLKVAQQNLSTTQAELQGVLAERNQFVPTAPFDGHFWLPDPDLAVGQWVGKKETLALLVRQGTPWRVETWLHEDEVDRVQVGQKAFFTLDSGSGPGLSLRVATIDRDAARVLPRRELDAARGGHVLTREKNGQLVPERAIYRVVLDVENPPDGMLPVAGRGPLTVHAEWSSPAGRYARQALSVLVREFGF